EDFRREDHVRLVRCFDHASVTPACLMVTRPGTRAPLRRSIILVDDSQLLIRNQLVVGLEWARKPLRPLRQYVPARSGQSTMRLRECYNFHDFRKLAGRRLPHPIFDYIDGAADDEVTHRRNTASFERCDLVPNVLRGVETADLSVTVLGQKLALPVYCSPTALQRLFHHEGERAVAAAAARHGTMFGVSSLGTVSLEELRKAHDTPQIYQFYFHKDRGLNRAMLQRAKGAGVEV